MKLNVERMDLWIWLVIIIPLLALGIYSLGLEQGIWLILFVPFIVLIKNSFLDDRLAWKPEYSVGIDNIDNDHKKLLELIRRLFKAIRTVGSQEEAVKILEELANYTNTHFKREEELLAGHDFPDLENHKKEHEVMINKVREFQSKFSQNETKVSQEILGYLQEWLVNHIMVTDKQYVPFLENLSKEG